MSRFDDTPYQDNVMQPFFEHHPEAVTGANRSIAQALTEADALTDFTIKFFDAYVAMRRLKGE